MWGTSTVGSKVVEGVSSTKVRTARRIADSLVNTLPGRSRTILQGDRDVGIYSLALAEPAVLMMEAAIGAARCPARTLSLSNLIVDIWRLQVDTASLTSMMVSDNRPRCPLQAKDIADDVGQASATTAFSAAAATSTTPSP